MKIFLEHKSIIILKARQLGISWLVVGYCLWKAIFFENVKVLFTSKGEAEAADLIGGGSNAVSGKARFIWSKLPDFIRPSIGRDTQGLIDFPATGGVLQALASTPNAGKSTDATIVVRDELAFHPYAENNYAAIRPTIDAGGQLIDLSTADKTKLEYHFKQRYEAAKSGESASYPIFLPWNIRPGRDLAWLERTRREYPPWQFEQEYPTKEKDALGFLKSVAFFSEESTENMLMDILTPLKVDEFQNWSSVRIYKRPVKGFRYCIFTDPSDGKEDPHAIIVMDWQTGEEVAESHGMMPAEEVANLHDKLVRFYNNAFNDFEMNATAGGIVSDVINNLGTINRHFTLIGNERRPWTTNRPRKTKMLDDLELAIRKGLIRPHSRECINEFKMMMRIEGVPTMTGGTHDDYIMAWAGVWQIRKEMPSSTGVHISSVKYKESL